MTRSSRGRAIELLRALVLACTAAAALALALACGAAPALAAPPPPPAAPAPPQLSARAAELIVAGRDQELYGYAQGRGQAIASATKLMTALVTLEHVPLSATFAQNDYYPAAVDSQIGLVPGERMTVHDLLLAALLPSADDAAEDLAYNVGHGSVARFVAMMNARARQLGLAHTNYSTPIGLDTPGNYSSASDLARLTEYLLAHQPFFARAVALPTAFLKTGPERHVTNRNTLVGRVPWINGVKTGHTLQAGYVLVGSGTQDGMSLISVVLGTPSESARDADTLALLRYGFANFHLVTPVRAGQLLAQPAIQDRPHRYAQLVAARSFTDVLPRSTPVHLRVDAPRQLAGPLGRGSRIGSVTVLAGSRPIARIGLSLEHALPAVSSLAVAGRFLLRASTLLALILLLAAAAGAAVFRRQRTRAKAAAASR
jgi:D-alanyl-D-alanine carboxypeptidase (penicillin-binding protein 5/6)